MPLLHVGAFYDMCSLVTQNKIHILHQFKLVFYNLYDTISTNVINASQQRGIFKICGTLQVTL
jgi:hypothetical protein